MKLIATLGPLKGLVVNLDQKPEWIIGRDSAQCNLVLEDASISRKHAKITLTDEGYVIKNLSTTNPVEVNEQTIDEYYLEEKDKIKIGNNYFLYTGLAKEDIIDNTTLDDEKLDELVSSSEKPLTNDTTPTEYKEREYNLVDEIESNNDIDETIFESSDELPTPLIADADYILKVISGPNAGSEFGMKKNSSYIVGKDLNTSDVIFTDLSVSGQNTKITIEDSGDIFVEDLNSKNGTYLNNKKIHEKTKITPSDLITLGTTTFLIVEKEASQETIYSPAPTFEEEVKEVDQEEKDKVLQKSLWKKDSIPTRHLAIGGTFIAIFFIIFLSFFGLFRAKTVKTDTKSPTIDISNITKNYEEIEFSYNPTSANLFLSGHVISSIDKQELLYDLNQLRLIQSIEDNVIIDESIAKDFNDTLNTQQDFRSISTKVYKPNEFILEGYVKSPADFQKLSDYINLNFPYVDRLHNNVVIDQILQVEISSKLAESNFLSINFEIISGELVLAGRYDENESKSFNILLSDLKKINGVHSIKNLAIPSSSSSARIDVTSKYKITGSAQSNGKNISVIANGKIVTIGDVLDSMIITAIEPSEIYLEKGDIKYKINYSL